MRHRVGAEDEPDTLRTVQSLRHLRRRIALLTSLVMLVGALMPALSMAWGTGQGKSLAEICTPQGMRWVAVAGDSADPSGEAPGSSGGLFDHCPFCSLGNHSPALVSDSVVLGLTADAGHLYPERFYSAAQTPHAWCTAQPRAPPAFS